VNRAGACDIRKFKPDKIKSTACVWSMRPTADNDGEIADILRRAGIDLPEKVQLV
jgi:hypothetical protein